MYAKEKLEAAFIIAQALAFSQKKEDLHKFESYSI